MAEPAFYRIPCLSSASSRTLVLEMEKHLGRGASSRYIFVPVALKNIQTVLEYGRFPKNANLLEVTTHSVQAALGFARAATKPNFISRLFGGRPGFALACYRKDKLQQEQGREQADLRSYRPYKCQGFRQALQCVIEFEPS